MRNDTKPALTEAKELMGHWIKDPVRGTRAGCIKYHYKEHGLELNAASVWDYLRMAESFRSQVRRVAGSPVIGLIIGVKRYRKGRYYIDIEGPVNSGRIVSFGLR